MMNISAHTHVSYVLAFTSAPSFILTLFQAHSSLDTAEDWGIIEDHYEEGSLCVSRHVVIPCVVICQAAYSKLRYRQPTEQRWSESEFFRLRLYSERFDSFPAPVLVQMLNSPTPVEKLYKPQKSLLFSRVKTYIKFRLLWQNLDSSSKKKKKMLNSDANPVLVVDHLLQSLDCF